MSFVYPNSLVLNISENPSVYEMIVLISTFSRGPLRATLDPNSTLVKSIPSGISVSI